MELISKVILIVKNSNLSKISKMCIITALKKRIPRKVVSIKRSEHNYQYTDYKCPVCGKLTKDGTPDFCWNCGQALDWNNV